MCLGENIFFLIKILLKGILELVSFMPKVKARQVRMIALAFIPDTHAT